MTMTTATQTPNRKRVIRLSTSTIVAVRAHNPGTFGSQAHLIYSYLFHCGPRGCTRDQIFLHTGIRIGSICARVSQMIKDGHVEIVRPAKMPKGFTAAKTSSGDVASVIRAACWHGPKVATFQPLKRKPRRKKPKRQVH